MDELKEPISPEDIGYHRMEHAMMISRLQHWDHVRLGHRVHNTVMTWDETAQEAKAAENLEDYEQTVHCLCHE